MNKLLADVNVLIIKFQNFHYNVVGEDFLLAHSAIQKEYEKLQNWSDEIAERIKMDGKYPVASLKEYLALSTVKEVESKDYTSKEIYPIIVEEYQTLQKELEGLQQTNLSQNTIEMLRELAESLDKEIWMFQAMSR